MFNSKATEAKKQKKTIHDLVRDFDVAVKKLVNDACDENIDLNIVAALMPYYCGQFRVTVAKMVAEENMRRIVGAPAPLRYNGRRNVETR